MKGKYRQWPLAAAFLAAMLLWPQHDCEAVAVSPRVVQAARGMPNEAGVLRRVAQYDAAKSLGVDHIYRQFALDYSRYPRGGIAHRNLLVVLCDFDADAYGPGLHHDAASTPAYYDSLLFSDDPDDGLTSLREYYRDNSHGRLLISGSVTPDWLTMPHSYAYYTNGLSGLDFNSYPRCAQKLAEDAMTAAYAAFGNDLHSFDNDGPDGIPGSADDDGYIDAVCVIHAGQGAEILTGTASDNALWSHETGITLYSECPAESSSPGCLPGMLLGGVRGFLYIMTPEYNDHPADESCGTYFHEFGHTLGLAELYDPNAAGLGFYSLMGVGNYLPLSTCNPVTDPNCPALGSHPGNLDAWSRQFIGFDAPVVPTQPGDVTLAPITRGGSVLKLWKNGQPGTEYFLVENRLQEGSDQYLPGQGVLVYHVDDTRTDDLGGPSAYRVRVVAADGRDDLESSTGDYGDAADFFPGTGVVRSLTEATIPSSRDYAGFDTGIRMTNIHGVTDGQADGTFHLALSTTPALQLIAFHVADGQNNLPDANEQDTLFVSVQNVGLASGPVGYTLTTTDPYVTVDAGASTSSAVASGAGVDLSTPFVVSVGSPPDLPHVVAFTLTWNDGSASGSTEFSLSIGMRVGLLEDFESGAPGWTHGPVAPSAADEWHLSASRAYDGNSSMKLGSSNALGVGTNDAQTYASMQDAVLVSPMFQLVPGAHLTFYSWIDAETNGGTGAWDGARVEISMNGGPWRALPVEGGYGYMIETGPEAALRGEDAFSGSPQTWRRVVADLSSYQGAARIRFRFSSDGANEPTDAFGGLMRYYEGWYVDGVAVSETPTAVSLVTESAVVEPGRVRLTWRAPGDDIVSTSLFRRTTESAWSLLGHPQPDRSHTIAYVDDTVSPGTRYSYRLLVRDILGDESSVETWVTVPESRGAPAVLGLEPARPNPFGARGELSYGLPHPGRVRLVVYDLQGRRVATVVDRDEPAGWRLAAWDGHDAFGRPVASGTYFVRLEAAGAVEVRKLVIAR